jgi:hypothetical protein
VEKFFQSKDSFLKRLDILQDKICKEGPNSVKLMGQVQTIAPPFHKTEGGGYGFAKKALKTKRFPKRKKNLLHFREREEFVNFSINSQRKAYYRS